MLLSKVQGPLFVLTTISVLTAAACGGGAPRPTPTTEPTATPPVQFDVRIAFHSHREGKPEIFVMNPDGSGQKRLSPVAENEDHAAWSRDGRQVAFIALTGRDSQIIAMNAD